VRDYRSRRANAFAGQRHRTARIDRVCVVTRGRRHREGREGEAFFRGKILCREHRYAVETEPTPREPTAIFSRFCFAALPESHPIVENHEERNHE
jgi:hypothetical protein